MIHRFYTYILGSFFLVAVLALQILQGEATSKSPYDSGYDHGCNDAEIEDENEQYINQPGKGPEFHTNLFMTGYYEGFEDCADPSNLPRCDGSYQDCVTHRGDVCKAGSTAHECEID